VYRPLILAHIMKAVRVKRDYEIEIGLTVDCEQLGLLSEETETAVTSIRRSA